MISSSPQSMGFSKPRPKISKEGQIPAPNRGVDARSALNAMSPENCIYTFNLMPEEYGCNLRRGFREWQIAIEDVTGLGVKTIIPFTGLSASKLFGATNEGIWDLTTDGGTPVKDVAFTADTTAAAGHGVFLAVNTAAANQIIFYADSLNGLFTYDGNGDTWAQTSSITGLAEADICFIVKHKQRIWVVERDSTSAWYLGVGAIAGAATEFFFGDKFPHGGVLKGLVNWSVDGGDGVDDMLVAVSSSGDVVVYRGADPVTLETAATGSGWSVVGTYYIGAVPEGRRFFSEHSGELYLLSSFGLIAMGDLLRGVDVRDKAAKSLTYPISKVLRDSLVTSGTTLGWEPQFIPSLGALVISSPQSVTSGYYIQYVMSLSAEAWGFWRGVPITCLGEWENKVFFGTVDNKVYIMEGTRDYVLIDTGDVDAAGFAVEFSLLTAYSTAGSPAINKIPQFVRSNFLTITPATFRTKVFFDYSIGEQVFDIGLSSASSEALWDTGLWDSAVWSAGEVSRQAETNGSSGIGQSMAIALRGESGDSARLVSFDVSWTEGGFL